MAQIDKFLTHILTKGGSGLRLEPGKKPMLEINGSLSPLLPTEMPTAVLDMLAGELVPLHLKSEWVRGNEISFEYTMEGRLFRLRMMRTQQGARIYVEYPQPLVPPAPRPPSYPNLNSNQSGGLSRVSALDMAAQEAEASLFGRSNSDLGLRMEAPALPPRSGRGTGPQPLANRTELDFYPQPEPDLEPDFLPRRMEARVDPPAYQTGHYPQPSFSPQPPSPPPPITASGLRTIANPQMVALAESMFAALLQQKGSDLHITATLQPLVRVHGELVPLQGFQAFSGPQMLDIMKSLVRQEVWEVFESTHDADFAYSFERGGCRLRMNYFMDRVGPGLVCRVIPNEIPDPDKLGLSKRVRDLAMLPKGLVLVTGPTGSGKSTTLAAIIDLANRQRSDHILTIEDPIEFVHPGKRCLVNQREVHTHTDSFKSGLRAALREDPDIILVGEMRDLETIAIAIETAVTGHLVFGTLHTSSAIGTVDRIVDQFPSDRQQQIRVMLGDALKAVVAQTLLKKIGGGRVAAMESLFVNAAVSNLIREGKNFQIASLMQTGKAQGQVLLVDALVDLVKSRQVEAEEAYYKAPDKELFVNACRRAGLPFEPRTE